MSQLRSAEVVGSEREEKMIELLCRLFTVHDDSTLVPPPRHARFIPSLSTVRFIAVLVLRVASHVTIM